MDLDKIRKAREQKSLTGGAGSLVVSKRRDSIAELKSSIVTKKETLEEKLAVRSARVISQVSDIIKSNRTEIVGIFDCSTSVEGTEKVTANSYYEMLEKERKKGYPTTVSTIIFGENDRVLHDRLDISEIKPFSYTAYGNTLFFDTFVKHLRRIDTIHKKMKPEEVPTKKLAVIMTDGGDNRSTKYNIEDARKLVEEFGANGWEFIYLCADKDLTYVASAMGIKSSNVEMYLTSGIKQNFEAVSNALDDLHEKGAISADWSKPIKENNRLRLTGGTNDKPNILKLK